MQCVLVFCSLLCTHGNCPQNEVKNIITWVSRAAYSYPVIAFWALFTMLASDLELSCQKPIEFISSFQKVLFSKFLKNISNSIIQRWILSPYRLYYFLSCELKSKHIIHRKKMLTNFWTLQFCSLNHRFIKFKVNTCHYYTYWLLNMPKPSRNSACQRFHFFSFYLIIKYFHVILLNLQRFVSAWKPNSIAMR